MPWRAPHSNMATPAGRASACVTIMWQTTRTHEHARAGICTPTSRTESRVHRNYHNTGLAANDESRRQLIHLLSAHHPRIIKQRPGTRVTVNNANMIPPEERRQGTERVRNRPSSRHTSSSQQVRSQPRSPPAARTPICHSTMTGLRTTPHLIPIQHVLATRRPSTGLRSFAHRHRQA